MNHLNIYRYAYIDHIVANTNCSNGQFKIKRQSNKELFFKWCLKKIINVLIDKKLIIFLEISAMGIKIKTHSWETNLIGY